MKINEILTKAELENCKHQLPFGETYSTESLEFEIANHYPEMNITDFLLFRILCELEYFNSREDNK